MADKISLIDAEIRVCRSKMQALEGNKFSFLRRNDDKVRAVPKLKKRALSEEDKNKFGELFGEVVKSETTVTHKKTNIPLFFKTQEDMDSATKKGKDGVSMIDSCKFFNDWVDTVTSNFTLNSITVQSLDMFGPRIGFIKVKADIQDKDGDRVPSIALLRGGSVAILVRIKCGDEYFSLLTKQARVPAGKYMLEIPAGMADESGDLAGVAIKELEEETGMSIQVTDLVDLHANVQDKIDRSYPSCGGCDEFMKLYLLEIEKSPTEVKKLQGKLTGELKELEKIKLVVVPFNDLIKISDDMKLLSALALYNAMVAKKAEEKAKAKMETFNEMVAEVSQAAMKINLNLQQLRDMARENAEFLSKARKAVTPP